jgi:hypothetical protein
MQEGAMPSKTSRKKSVNRILNVLPSINVVNDWRFENAEDAGIVAAAPPPPAKDLRSAWWKINDQGTTGSCVGWATADGLLRWHFVQAGRLANNELLSPRFTWMAAKETDEFSTRPTTFIEPEGTSLKAALDISRNFGAVRDKELPFKSGSLYQKDAKSFYATAAALKIASYFNLGRNLADWRAWLAQNGPLLVRLDVDSTWDNATATKGKLVTYDAASARGGHAVTLVGYSAGQFIVRNSWGTAWGDKGFAYASDAYAQVAFTEAYGVSV